MKTYAEPVNALVELFQWMANPDTGPHSIQSANARKFRRLFVKRREGGELEESDRLFLEAALREPDCPQNEIEQITRWPQLIFAPAGGLPLSLSPPAQLLWLGINQGATRSVIDAALHRLFALSHRGRISAYEEAIYFFEVERTNAEMGVAALQDWVDPYPPI